MMFSNIMLPEDKQEEIRKEKIHKELQDALRGPLTDAAVTFFSRLGKSRKDSIFEIKGMLSNIVEELFERQIQEIWAEREKYLIH